MAEASCDQVDGRRIEQGLRHGSTPRRDDVVVGVAPVETTGAARPTR